MATTSAEVSPQGRHILVVEDEAMVAMLIEDMLVKLGHAVVGPFAQIEPAVTAAERESLDAALLDVNIDGRAVYPVAEALIARAIPFAFVTGYDSRGLIAPWQKRPSLEKPFRLSNLERLLDELLSNAY